MFCLLTLTALMTTHVKQVVLTVKMKNPACCSSIQGLSESGAGNEIRTRDLNLGKVALYQLSYSRVAI